MKVKPTYFDINQVEPREHLCEVYCLVNKKEVAAWYGSKKRFAICATGEIVRVKYWRYRQKTKETS